MARVAFFLSLWLAGFCFAGPVTIVNEDHETSPFPYLYSHFAWEGGFCCDGDESRATISSLDAHEGSQSLANVLKFDYAEAAGVSSDTYVTIPEKYLPVDRVVVTLWRKVHHLSHPDSGGTGFCTVSLRGEEIAGISWNASNEDHIEVYAQTKFNESDYLSVDQDYNAWENWSVVFDIVDRRMLIYLGLNHIAVRDIEEGVIDNPRWITLGNAVHFPGGSGSADNLIYDDNVVITVTPSCDPILGDCDGNFIADRCDIDPELGGSDPDCNNNGIPDVCEPDCDGDFIIDDCDDQSDSDSDGTSDECDDCDDDPNKTLPGICGCGVSDVDTDSDGSVDCNDNCPDDPTKKEPGICGCGAPDVDENGDGVFDCIDLCADDPNKTAPGICGCGTPDIDSDDDGFLDCEETCIDDVDKQEPGVCGCGISETDSDDDGTPDCADGCPDDGEKTAIGICGCGEADVDTDDDGIIDCFDLCVGENEDVDENGCNIPVAVVEEPEPDDPDMPEDVDEPNLINDVAEEIIETGEVEGVAMPNACGACGSVGMLCFPMMFMGLAFFRRF